MTAARRSWFAVALLAVLALVAAACTGVPTSSGPSTVQPVDIGGGQETQQPPPTRNADARTIVQEFLSANALDPRDHASARRYLAPSVRRSWGDETATIVNNNISVSREANGVVTLTGRVVGELRSNGVYSPEPTGVGDGGAPQKFPYRIGKVDGQNRITGLRSGLVLTQSQFDVYYQQHALYFFDQSRRFLVPDTRWTALDGVALDTWLVSQLAAGPRTDLADVVTDDTLPTQAKTRRISAAEGTPLKIEVPGSSQLDAAAKRRLAAQVGASLTEPTSSERMVLTDGGGDVPLPDSAAGEFSAAQLYPRYAPPTPSPDVFYLADGNVVRSGGTPLPGRLKSSRYALTSVAVTEAKDGSLVVAGVTPYLGNALVIGTEASGYQLTSVRGVTARPSFAAGFAGSAGEEVWVGVRDKVYRVAVSGNRAAASEVTVSSSVSGGSIAALRLSPEGARIALVIASQSGRQRLYVGGIVRASAQVRVDALPLISPDGVSIDDVAWIGTQKLIAVGNLAGGDLDGDPRIFETNVDGSGWTARTIGSVLPGAPDSVTAAVGQLAWVSTSDSVWKQLGRSWEAPNSTGQTVGDKPVYLE